MNCPVHNTPMRPGGALSPLPGECLYYCPECYKAVRAAIDPGRDKGEFSFYWAGPMPFNGTYPDPRREVTIRESCEGRKPGDQS